MTERLQSPTTKCSNDYNKKEVRERYQASFKYSDPLATEEKYTVATRKCTNLVWMKNAPKDCDVPKEVLTKPL